MFTFTADWAAVLQMFVIPVAFPSIVGLVSNSNWPTLVKRLTLGVLILLGNILAAVAGALNTGATINLFELAFQWLMSWGIAELIYWGIYKAPITKPSVVETPIETQSTDVKAYTKTELVGLVSQVTGEVPDSKLTKEQLGAIIDSHSAVLTAIEIVPPKSFADILANKGNVAS